MTIFGSIQAESSQTSKESSNRLAAILIVTLLGVYLGFFLLSKWSRPNIQSTLTPPTPATQAQNNGVVPVTESAVVRPENNLSTSLGTQNRFCGNWVGQAGQCTFFLDVTETSARFESVTPYPQMNGVHTQPWLNLGNGNFRVYDENYIDHSLLESIDITLRPGSQPSTDTLICVTGSGNNVASFTMRRR